MVDSFEPLLGTELETNQGAKLNRTLFCFQQQTYLAKLDTTEYKTWPAPVLFYKTRRA